MFILFGILGVLGWMIAKGAQFGKIKNKIVVALVAAVIGAVVFPAITYCTSE